jgi:hypothetical protein
MVGIQLYPVRGRIAYKWRSLFQRRSSNFLKEFKIRVFKREQLELSILTLLDGIRCRSSQNSRREHVVLYSERSLPKLSGTSNWPLMIFWTNSNAGYDPPLVRPVSGPDRGRNRDGVTRHQRSHGDVRPGEGVEVQKDLLRVLDLRRFNGDRARLRDLDRRVHKELRNGLPALPVSAGIVSGGWPGMKIGTTMTCSTISIQNVAVIFNVWAFGPAATGLVNAAGSPSRKAILSAPPPNSGAAGLVEMEIVVVAMMFSGAMWLRRSVLGSVNIACVMVPAAMKEVRSCGIRGVLLLVAV